MAAAKALGTFKRKVKQRSESDLWLQRVISSPEKYGVVGICEDDGAPDSERKTDQQSYSAWKAVRDLRKFGHPLRMRRKNLVLQPLIYSLGGTSKVEVEDGLDPSVLALLRDFCTAFFFGTDVMVAEPALVRKETVRSRVHPSTNATQLLAPDVFRSILRLRQIKAFATLGVTNLDLYPSEEWNFSLGHASTTDGCGVFSIGHYHDQRLSTEPIQRGDVHYQRCKMWRLIKVVTHETCHMFGLAHCSFFHCLMNESSSIPEAEGQPLFLCPVCLRKMCKALKFDILTRYSAMLEQLRRLSIELHDTCHCATWERRGSEDEEVVVCDVGGNRSISKDTFCHCATKGTKCSEEKDVVECNCSISKDTCHCATRQRVVSEEEEVVCGVGSKHHATSKDYNSAVILEPDHSAVAEVGEEELTAVTCNERGPRSVAQPDNDVMQEEDSSCSTCDCQMEHMRKATKWLEVQLRMHRS